jgi:hypothetical protein
MNTNAGSGTAQQTQSPRQQFTISVLCVVVVPLLSLVAELWVRGEIKPDNLAVAATVYVASSAVGSRYPLFFVGGLISAGVLAFIYGIDLVIGGMAASLHGDDLLRANSIQRGSLLAPVALTLVTIGINASSDGFGT